MVPPTADRLGHGHQLMRSWKAGRLPQSEQRTQPHGAKAQLDQLLCQPSWFSPAVHFWCTTVNLPVWALGISIAISYCSCCRHHTGFRCCSCSHTARQQHAAAAEHAKKGKPHSVCDAVDHVAWVQPTPWWNTMMGWLKHKFMLLEFESKTSPIWRP